MNPTTNILKLTNHAGHDRVEVYINDCGDGPEIVLDVWGTDGYEGEDNACAWLSAGDAEAIIGALGAAIAHVRA